MRTATASAATLALCLLPLRADDDTTFKLLTDVVPTVDIVTDAASGLISAGTGEKNVEVIVDSSLAIPGGKAEAVLTRCDAEGSAGKDGVPSATAALKAGQTRQRVAFRLRADAFGLYEVTFRVRGSDNALLAEQKSSLAAVPSRDGVGADDWGIRANLARGKGSAAVASLDWLRLAGFSRVRDDVYGQAAAAVPQGIDFAARAQERGLAVDGQAAPRMPTPFKAPEAFPDVPEKADLYGPSKRIDEWGWSTAPVSYGLSDLLQAAYLVRTYLGARRSPGGPVFWYAFRDDGNDPAEQVPHFGLIRSDFSPKASYVAAAVLSATLGKRPWSKDYVATDAARVMAFGTGADAVVAGWVAQPGGLSSSVHLALPPGNYLLRDWRGSDSPVAVGPGGYDWVLGPVPQYLIPASSN
ncbi:hypothetical protein [Verrucomicrobium sp. GAS474]|uniref:hypothetical protein n=1 Tax=Verrucomicrobium sp. GAS474 TaxID=1882831 RepID=UPI0012FFCF11|nr:hypothetical protein [Verrucomicrobium sp. GAS474]